LVVGTLAVLPASSAAVLLLALFVDAAVAIGGVAVRAFVVRRTRGRAFSAGDAQEGPARLEDGIAGSGRRAGSSGLELLGGVGRALRVVHRAGRLRLAGVASVAVSALATEAAARRSASDGVGNPGHASAGDVRACPKLAGQLAALTAARAGGVATDPFGGANQSGTAIGVGNASLAGRQLPAAAIVRLQAGEPVRTIGVRGAVVEACGAGLAAHVRAARCDAGSGAGALAVAGCGQGVRASRARVAAALLAAPGRRGPRLALASAVASPGVAAVAGGRVAGSTARLRIRGPRGNVGTGPRCDRRRALARLAQTARGGVGASAVAADPLRAEAALALARSGAGRAVHLETATTGGATRRWNAVLGFGGQRATDLAGAVLADEATAGLVWGRDASAFTVAGGSRCHRRRRRRCGARHACGGLAANTTVDECAPAATTSASGATGQRVGDRTRSLRIRRAVADGFAHARAPGQVACHARPRARSITADPLRTEARLTIAAFAALGAVHPAPTGVVVTDVAVAALGIAHARSRADAAAAAVRAARAGGHGRTLLIVAAHPGRIVGPVGAAFGTTHGIGWIVRTSALPIAEPIGQALVGALVLADLSGIGIARGDVETTTGRAWQVAASASPLARALATHAVHALARFAVVGARADLAVLALTADPLGHTADRLGHAGVPRLADIGAVGITAGVAHVGGTKEGRAIDELGSSTAPATIASTRRLLGGLPALGRGANRVLPIERASARPVARAGATAAARVLTVACGIRPVGRKVGAAPFGAGLRASHACPSARDVAAHVIHAESRQTPIVAVAFRTVDALTAGACHALVIGRALGIGGALADAAVVLRIASVGRAGLRLRLGAIAGAVAGPDAFDGVALAGACLALGASGILPASALAVAGAVETAGPR